MAQSTDRRTTPPIERLRTTVELLESPALARMYAHVLHAGPTTTPELVAALGVPQGTAYEHVGKLEAVGLFEKTHAERPAEYEAKAVSLTLSTDSGTRTITPELVDAVARRTDNGDIDIYVDRHGIDGLAVALDYAREYVDGEVNHRTAARELDVSPLEAEIVLQALEPVVLAHRDG
jgi:DNA-binding MarR family transcriptional regulator